MGFAQSMGLYYLAICEAGYRASLGNNQPSLSIKSNIGGSGGGYYPTYKENKVQKSDLTNGEIGNIVADAYVGAGTNNYSTSNFPLALELKDIITIGLPVSISFPLSIPILLMSATAIIPGDTPIDRPQDVAVPLEVSIPQQRKFGDHHIATDKHAFWRIIFGMMFRKAG